MYQYREILSESVLKKAFCWGACAVGVIKVSFECNSTDGSDVVDSATGRRTALFRGAKVDVDVVCSISSVGLGGI